MIAALPPHDPALLRPNLFGRPDLAAVYRQAQALVVHHNLFRIVNVERRDDGVSRLIICHLWAVERSPEGQISAFEYDLISAQWVPASELDYWPDIPLFPIQKAQSLDWWRKLAERVLWKVLLAAGYTDLTFRTLPDGVGSEMSRKGMANRFLRHYLGFSDGMTKSGKPKWRNGFLKPKVMVAGAKALRAGIFEHVLDRELVSVALSINYTLTTLRDYLRYAFHRTDVLRIAQERRNMLPILPWIATTHWHRRDLFSRALWVKADGSPVFADSPNFPFAPSIHFRAFDSFAAFRWLCKAKLTVVRRWASCRNPDVLENLAAASIQVSIPAIAWCHIVSIAERPQLARLGVGEPAQRLYRAFARHCATLWATKGFSVLRDWLKRNPHAIADVADWLVAEGVDQGFPDKHSTWESMQRRCADWHRRVALSKLRLRDDENDTWESLLGEEIADGVTFTPLVSTHEVAVEGYSQKHCVAVYAPYCVKGAYRVFAAVDSLGARSTLGLMLDRSGCWVVEQHRGPYNDPVSPEVRRAGENIAARYQDAHIKRFGAT